MTEMSVKDFNALKKAGKKSKYSNTFTVVDGIKFRSKKEAEYYKKLKILQDAGKITELELQPRFPYHIIYTLKTPNSPIIEKKGAYISDFRITWDNGNVDVVDTKGFSTRKFIRDKEITEKLYGIEIKIV